MTIEFDNDKDKDEISSCVQCFSIVFNATDVLVV